MTSVDVRKALNSALETGGFARRGSTWSRRQGDFIDAVTFEKSKDGSDCTVECAVIHAAIYSAVWGWPLGSPTAADGTVRTRVGLLAADRDHWWPLNGESEPAELVHCVMTYGVPWLQSMHSDQAMIARLQTATGLERGAPHRVSLALLLRRSGDTDAACHLLREIAARTPGAWARRAAEMASELCGKDGSRGD